MATSRRLSSLIFAIFILAIVPASAVDGIIPDSGSAGGAEPTPGSELAEVGILCARVIRTEAPTPFPSCTPPIHRGRTLISRALWSAAAKAAPKLLLLFYRHCPLALDPTSRSASQEMKSNSKREVAPPGTLVLLPNDATTLVSGSWQTLEDLFIRIDDGQSTIHGVVKLAGLAAAFKKLQASCDHP